MCRLILIAALALAGCGSRPAECTRISTAEVLRGEAVTDLDGHVHHFVVTDRNGLTGVVNASNSNSFTCRAITRATGAAS